ncbi:MAG: hypothetical protein ACFFB5_23265 [Promethearchaeota archaeon]
MTRIIAKACVVTSTQPVLQKLLHTFREQGFPFQNIAGGLIVCPLSIEEGNIKVQLWITNPKADYYRAGCNLYYQGSSYALFLYETRDDPSFHRVMECYKDFRQFSAREDSPVVFLGLNSEIDDFSQIKFILSHMAVILSSRQKVYRKKNYIRHSE